MPLNSKNSINPPHSKTSIGKSVNSRPTGKHRTRKRNFKKSRGQGK